MIVDFHTHVFPDKIASSTISALEKNSNGKANTDGSVSGLISHMKESGVDLAVALPVLTKPSQFESVMNFAIGINQAYSNTKERLISFGGIHPCCDDIKGKMKALKDNGFLGVKIHPDYQNTFIDDEGYIEILECAKELDLIVVTHAGVDDGYIGQPVKCPPELCLKVIDKVNHNKFVLAHFGGHKQWQTVFDILCGKEVYFDTAFTLHEIEKDLFLNIVEKHGDNKVLFATDCPWRNMKEDISIIKSYGLSESSLDNILYKNALRLLKL